MHARIEFEYQRIKPIAAILPAIGVAQSARCCIIMEYPQIQLAHATILTIRISFAIAIVRIALAGDTMRRLIRLSFIVAYLIASQLGDLPTHGNAWERTTGLDYTIWQIQSIAARLVAIVTGAN